MGCNPSLIDQEPATFDPYDRITELERQVSDLTAERDRWDKLVTAIDFIQVRVSAIEGTFAVISHDRIGELWEVDNELERNQYISPIEAYESIK